MRAGGHDPPGAKCRTTADWTERLLKAGVPCGPIYTVDRMFEGLTDALVNNQVDYALSYSGRVYAAAKAGAKVALVKDQQILSWDQYAVVKGTKNKAAAEALLRSIAQPEPQRHLSELTSYAMANSTSPPQLDALSARFLPSRENAVFQDMAWWAKNYDQINQRFVTWQSQ